MLLGLLPGQGNPDGLAEEDVLKKVPLDASPLGITSPWTLWQERAESRCMRGPMTIAAASLRGYPPRKAPRQQPRRGVLGYVSGCEPEAPEEGLEPPTR